MNNLRLKFARLSTVIVLSLCMLCTNNVKTYAQVTLSFTPSDGSTLTFMDVFLQLINYIGQGIYQPGTTFSAYTEAQKIDQTVFVPGGASGAVVSISAPNVKEIGRRAFMGSLIAKIAEGDFPSLERIEEEAFMGCNDLTELNLPASCIVISPRGFMDCKKLVNAELPGILDIHPSTFSGCSALKEVYIPVVRIIFEHGFDGCTNLRSSFGELTPIGKLGWFETDASAILEYAFRGCKSIEKLSCPKLIVAREASFSGCTGITELSLPVATRIETEAFGECSSLQKLSLPATESIEMFAFVDCSGLTELALPKIKSIESYAFLGCPNIRKVSFGKGHTEAQMITLSETIFGSTQTRAAGEANASFPENLELELGENVLPKPVGNSWNGYTWKSVTVAPAETGIKKIPVANALKVYPNPAKENATVSFELANACDVQIALSDMSGRKLTDVYKGFTTAGIFTKTFNAGHLANGVYLLSILVDGNYSVKEIIVSR